MTEQDIKFDPTSEGFQLVLEDTEIGSLEFKEKKALWSNELNAVKRFEKVPTIHKSSLLEHVIRVNALAVRLKTYLEDVTDTPIDLYKLIRLTHRHDDAEVIIGDFPSPEKAAFTPEEKDKYHRQEDEAMVTLAERYMPERFKQLYLDDWEEVKAKQTPEAQLVEISDKWDGLCETLTDIRSGNDSPEIFEVLENYQALFNRLDKLPVMKILKQNPSFGFNKIPTVEEAKSFTTYREYFQRAGADEADFWKWVFDPSLPAVYKYWLRSQLATNYPDLGIFPRWRNTIRDFRIPQEQKEELFNENVVEENQEN